MSVFSPVRKRNLGDHFKEIVPIVKSQFRHVTNITALTATRPNNTISEFLVGKKKKTQKKDKNKIKKKSKTNKRKR
tara:strand:- start:51 stop:278 length:228 start_codon:yes stop_codon:yes gene_type:complete